MANGGSARRLPAKSELAARPAQSGTVRVVADEPAVRETVRIALDRFGYTVHTAKDGVEAWAVFRQHRDEVHCVLCDLTMPRMNGWKTLAALRKLSPGIPVSLSSGYSEAQVMEGIIPNCLRHSGISLISWRHLPPR